jgi:hypothetical protein
VTGAPAPNLPNLDQLRNLGPEQPHASQPTQANLMCADCDPQSGGGGSQYYPAGDPNFSTARELPQNETGEAGVDLGSRNFNWSQPLLSLAGRSGMDLSLSLFYNSLVWTKDGSYIKYNADLGTPAPGFRLGLPILQRKFFDSQAHTNAYLSQLLPFSGNVMDNLRAGARAYTMDILKRSTSLADAAGLFRAGSRTGPGYRDRFNQYQQEAPGDKRQLNCLQGAP